MLGERQFLSWVLVLYITSFVVIVATMGNAPSSPASSPVPVKRRRHAALLRPPPPPPDFEGWRVRKGYFRTPVKVESVADFVAAKVPCWNMGMPHHLALTRLVASRSKTPPDLMEDTRVVTSTFLRVHLPVFNAYYAVVEFKKPRTVAKKSSGGHKGFTLAEVMGHVHETATLAMAGYLSEQANDRPAATPSASIAYRQAQVSALLKRQRVCRLLLSKADPPGQDVFVVLA